MKLYHYDPTTGLHTATTDARPDPLQPNAWIVPAFSTKRPILNVPSTHTNQYDREEKVWRSVSLATLQAQAQSKRKEQANFTESKRWAAVLARGFDGLLSEHSAYCETIARINLFPGGMAEAMTYCDDSTDAKTQALALALRAWRSRTRMQVLDMADHAATDKTPLPDSLDAFIARLETFAAPASEA